MSDTLVFLEDPLGDALDRLAPPDPPRGDTYLIHLTPGAGAQDCEALFAAAAAQGVRELVILDDAAASALPAASPVRVVVAGRLVQDPQLEAPPRVVLPAGEFEARLLDLEIDPDGTWRRVRPRLKLASGEAATLFAPHSPGPARLALIRASAVVSLPAERAIAESSPAPWRGGRWVVARPTPSEPLVWTPRRERVRESRAVALALLALEGGHVLRPAHWGWVALAGALLFSLCSLPAPADPRLAAFGALALAGASLAGLVVLRSSYLIAAPILPLVASPLLGFVSRLLRSERSVRERVAWLDDDLRRDRALTTVGAPPSDAASVEALVELSGAAAGAIRLAGLELTFARAGAREGAAEAALEAARAESPGSEPFLETALGPAVRVELGRGGQVGLLPPSGDLAEATEWWRARAGLLSTCLQALIPTGPSEEPGERELVFSLRANVRRIALERAFTIRVLRQLPEAVAIYDALGRPLLSNAQLSELSERYPEAVGLPALLSALSGQGRDASHAKVAEVLDAGRAFSSYVTLEPEGRHFALLVERLELEGHGRFLVLVARDVTELFALERSRGVLVRGLSDDLRAALQRISLGLELVNLQFGEEAARASSALTRIRADVEVAVESLSVAERRSAVSVASAAGEAGPLDLSLELARALEQVGPTAAQLGATLAQSGQRFTSVVWARSRELRGALCSALADLLLSIGEGGQGEVRTEEELEGVRLRLRESGERTLQLSLSEETARAAAAAEIECSLSEDGLAIEFFLPRAPSPEGADSGESGERAP